MAAPTIILSSAMGLVRSRQAWQEELGSGHRTAGPLLIVVATPEICRHWPIQASPQLRVVALEEFAAEILGGAVVRPPHLLSAILEANLPAELAHQIHPEPIPGLHLNAIETILECRSLGFGSEQLGKYGGFWNLLWQWIDQSIPDSLLDAWRLYREAGNALGDASLPYRAVWVDQAGLMPGSSIDFLAALSRRAAMTVAIERRPGLGPLLRQWQRWSPRWIRGVQTQDALGTVRAVVASPEAMAVTALASLESWAGTTPIVVLDDASGYGQDLLRQVSGPEAIGGGFQGSGSALQRWLRFWHVSQASASRSETLRWLTDVDINLDSDDRARLWRNGRVWQRRLEQREPASQWMRWARQWGSSVGRAKSLAEVVALAHAGLDRQGFDAPALREELRRLTLMHPEGLNVSPSLLRLLMETELPGPENGSDQNEESGRATPTGSLCLRSSLTQAGLVGGQVVAWYGSAPAPKERPLGVLLPRAARRALGFGALGADLDRFVLRGLPARVDDTLYIVSRDQWSDFERTMPLGAVESPPSGALRTGSGYRETRFASSAAWYHSHRDRTDWDAWSGLVGEPATAAFATPSSAEQYGRCPLAYFYQNVLQVGTPDVDEDRLAPTRALIGRWAHATLEIGARVPGLFATADLHTLRERMPRLVDLAVDAVPASVSHVPELLRAAKLSLASELTEAVWRHRGVWADRGDISERALNWTYGGVQWHGRVDHLSFGSGAAPRLYDYKTGTVSDPNQVRPDNLQLPLYRQAVAQTFGVLEDQVEAWLIGVSARSGFKRRPLISAGALEGVVRGLAERISQGRFHPLPLAVNHPCRTCAFRRACPDLIVKEAAIKGANAPAFRALWVAEEDGS